MDDNSTTVDKQQKTTSVKSHEEILELFQEIEQIEQELKNPDISSEPKEIISSDEEQLHPESQKETITETANDISRKKKKSFKKMFTPREKKKFRIKKRVKEKKSVKQKPAKKKLFKKTKKPSVDKEKSLDPIHSTFTLKLDKSGNLVGLEIPQAKKPKQKFSLKTVLKKKSKKSDSEKIQPSDVKGIKALPVKLKGLVSHIPFLSKKLSNKDKPASDSKTSKLSSIPKKIKGIFSKK